MATYSSSFKTNPTKSSKDVIENQPFSRQDFIAPENNNRMSKGDVKPEVHFIGQITGGLDFGTNDGLFCEMILDIGNNWDRISPPRLYQTQTTYANVKKKNDFCCFYIFLKKAGFMHVWNHPIDLHFAANDLNGW